MGHSCYIRSTKLGFKIVDSEQSACLSMAIACKPCQSMLQIALRNNSKKQHKQQQQQFWGLN